jgi:hypothetical protein
MSSPVTVSGGVLLTKQEPKLLGRFATKNCKKDELLAFVAPFVTWPTGLDWAAGIPAIKGSLDSMAPSLVPPALKKNGWGVLVDYSLPVENRWKPIPGRPPYLHPVITVGKTTYALYADWSEGVWALACIWPEP